MKKMSKTVFGFMLGIIISFTLNVAAQAVISSGAVSYSNAATSETTVSGALDELFSAVNINAKIGDIANIQSIGDGTIAGAISTLNTNLTKQLNNFSIQAGTVSVSAVSGENTFTVSFPKPFLSTPVVVMTPRHNTGNSATLKIRTKDLNGFTGSLSVNHSNVSYVVEWIAIGLL